MSSQGRQLNDIDKAIKAAAEVSHDDIREKLLIQYFQKNHKIDLGGRLLQDVACQTDKRNFKYWYHRLEGEWVFYQKNSKITKLYPAQIVARVLHPNVPFPHFNPKTFKPENWNVYADGGFQFSPEMVPFTKSDLLSLLSNVSSTHENYAQALKNLLDGVDYKITAAPHRSDTDKVLHITIDADLPDGQIHVVVAHKPLASNRQDNKGFIWAKLNLIFINSKTKNYYIR